MRTIPLDWYGSLDWQLRYVQGDGPTGSFMVEDAMVLRGAEEYLSPALYGQPDTWQCQYCGSKYWIEDRELNCKKCGAPRDI